MLAITAVIRPEKVMDVQDALYSRGYCAMTKLNVSGRGKERGIKVGEVLYQEMMMLLQLFLHLLYWQKVLFHIHIEELQITM